MLIYLSILLLFSFLGIIYAFSTDNIIKISCIYIYVVVFIFFYSFSCNIGFDWPPYKIFYETLPTKKADYLLEINLNFEPLFVLTSYLLSKISADYQFLVFVLSSCSVLLYYDIFKKLFGKYVLIVLSFFCILYGNRLFVSTLRQNIAVIFIFYMYYEYLKNSKRWIIYFIIACFFHYTSVIILLAVVLDKLRIKREIYVIIIILFLCLFLMGYDFGKFFSSIILTIAGLENNYITNKILVYGTTNILSNVTVFDMFYAVLAVVIFIFSKKINIFHTIIFVFLLFYYLFPSAIVISARIKYFCTIGFIYLIIQEKKYTKNIVLFKFLMIYCYCFAFYTSIYIFSRDAKAMIPYENYLIHKVVYPYRDPYDIRKWEYSKPE
ncbi:MAG: EpsG family protein [Bacteroidales bacterium]|jgi:hypothetical protein|nr:EpsG family protein [Bacteroidales bacterium]